jgi:ABC-2 type transport system ATP-binding protein
MPSSFSDDGRIGWSPPREGTNAIGASSWRRDHPAPIGELGAVLEARSVHSGRSAYNHLLALAQSHGIGRSRVNELIEQVGLREVAQKRVGGFSLGMGQRLGIASALLADPQIVMLDEPVNVLDAEGIQWVRNLLKRLAGEAVPRSFPRT